MSHIEATSCRLPLLDGETGTESQHKIIAFELEDTTILHDHGKGDVASLNGLLCTAWGLLLRCFTGQDSVAFQFRQSIIDNVNLTSGVPRIQQSGFQIAFQEHEPLSMCLAKAKDAYAGTEWGRASSVSEMSELRSSTAATHQNTYVHVQDTAHENTQDVVIQKVAKTTVLLSRRNKLTSAPGRNLATHGLHS